MYFKGGSFGILNEDVEEFRRLSLKSSLFCRMSMMNAEVTAENNPT